MLWWKDWWMCFVQVKECECLQWSTIWKCCWTGELVVDIQSNQKQFPQQYNVQLLNVRVFNCFSHIPFLDHTLPLTLPIYHHLPPHDVCVLADSFQGCMDWHLSLPVMYVAMTWSDGGRGLPAVPLLPRSYTTHHSPSSGLNGSCSVLHCHIFMCDVCGMYTWHSCANRNTLQCDSLHSSPKTTPLFVVAVDTICEIKFCGDLAVQSAYLYPQQTFPRFSLTNYNSSKLTPAQSSTSTPSSPSIILPPQQTLWSNNHSPLHTHP